MSAATNAAMMAAMASTPHTLVSGALVGGALPDGVDSSPLIGLLVADERAELATGGENGAALFTSMRVIVAERVGLLNKRLAVKAFSRGSIIAYTIDPDTHVTLMLLGGFGQATLVFDQGFDPMSLSDWLGQTLARTFAHT